MSRGKLSLVICLLVAVNIAVYSSGISLEKELHVSILDVGQGDSILIQGPTGIQMLIDGGVGHAVLAELAEEMGMLDRSIDIVVETHPDADHIGGLPAVFDRYEISYFIEPGIPSETPMVKALNAAVEQEGDLRHHIARRGMQIDLGGGAYADILYPDRDPSELETNTGSIVMRIVYGKTSFMFTGDLPSEVEDWLVAVDGEGRLKSDFLKAGHHGSKNSTNEQWLATVRPTIVAISAGEGNLYGHPSPDVIQRIRNVGADIYSTIDSGTLKFIADGDRVSHIRN